MRCAPLSCCRSKQTHAIMVLFVVVVLVSLVSAGCSNGAGPMRVCFNVTFAVNQDAGTCYAAGQTVQLCTTNGDCFAYTCTAADVVELAVLQSCLPLAAASASKLFLDHLCVPAYQSQNTFENCLRSTETFSAPCDHVVTVTMQPAPRGITGAGTHVTGSPASTFTCRFAERARPSAAWMNIVPNVVSAQLTARGATAASVADPSTSAVAVTAGVELFRALLLHYASDTLGVDITQLYAWTPPGSGGTASYLTVNATQYPYGPVFPMDAASDEIMYHSGEAAAYGFFNGSLVTATRRVMLITPTLVQVAREYFDCPTLSGVLLEELIPSGILLERRLLPFEVNTAPLGMPDRAAWSIFSIALLVDTGFYVLGDGIQLLAGRAGDPYYVGYKAGCAYTQGCSPSSSPTWAAYCCNGTYGIGYDATFASQCGNGVMPSARWQAPYQHFSFNATVGGWDAYADYCPYASNTTSTDGSGSSVVASCLSGAAYTVSRTVQGNTVDAQHSSRVGPGTRAAFTTLLNTSFTLPTRNLFENVPRCVAFLCLNASLLLFRGGDSWYPCTGEYPAVSELMYPFPASLPIDHAPFDPATAQTSYFYYGQILCPDPRVVCSLVATNTEGTKNADMYGAGGYLNPSTYPVLYNVTPATGSVLGGTLLTVLGLNLFTPNSQVLTDCRGLLVGGQPTNWSTFVRGQSAYVDGVLLQSFLVATSAIDLTTPILGGTAADGSGVVDVELLCQIPNALQCGPQFDGYCGVDRQRAAFVLEPAPLAAGTLGFIATTAGTALVAGLGTLALVIMLVFAALYNRRELSAASIGEEGKDVDGEEMSARSVGGVIGGDEKSFSDSGGGGSLSVSLLKVDDTAVVTLNAPPADGRAPAAAAAKGEFVAQADGAPVASSGVGEGSRSNTVTANPQQPDGDLEITLDSDDDPPPPPPPEEEDDDEDVPPPPPPPPPSAPSSSSLKASKLPSMTSPPSRRSSNGASSRKAKSGRSSRSSAGQLPAGNEDDDEPPPPPPAVEL